MYMLKKTTEEIFTETQDRTRTHKLSAFRAAPLWSVTEVLHGGVGQQAQDGGEAVQFLLDNLWKLLVLLVPASVKKRRTREKVRKVFKSPVGFLGPQVGLAPGDPPVGGGGVGDAGDPFLDHQLGAVVELHPHLAAGQLEDRGNGEGVKLCIPES